MKSHPVRQETKESSEKEAIEYGQVSSPCP